MSQISAENDARISVPDWINAIHPPDAADPTEVQAHLDALTKPLRSLGRLEETALRLACITGDPPPPLKRRTVFTFAADHGVAVQGVSAFPPEVTAQMCANFCTGGAAVNALARANQVNQVVADLGVAADLSNLVGIEHRKIRSGTGDLSVEPAMTGPELAQAIAVGIEIFSEIDPPPQIVALGEMGIANSTAASALTAALLDVSVSHVVGPGTGLEPDRVSHKVRVVEQAVGTLNGDEGPLEILRRLGGLEIAGLVGVIFSAARVGIPIVTDGFIATSAALAAVEIQPSCNGYLFASHRSPEPGHELQLHKLGLMPLLDLGMRLGEGTGAVLAIPIIDSAGAILRDMATFESAAVSGEVL